MGNWVILRLLAAIALFWVSRSFADSTPVPQDMGLPFTGRDASTSIALIIKETIKYVGVLAVIALSWGGIQFLLSAGEDQKVKTAKNIVIYALVGVLLSITAYTIVDIVIAFRLS